MRTIFNYPATTFYRSMMFKMQGMQSLINTNLTKDSALDFLSLCAGEVCSNKITFNNPFISTIKSCCLQHEHKPTIIINTIHLCLCNANQNILPIQASLNCDSKWYDNINCRLLMIIDSLQIIKTQNFTSSYRTNHWVTKQIISSKKNKVLAADRVSRFHNPMYSKF